MPIARDSRSATRQQRTRRDLAGAERRRPVRRAAKTLRRAAGVCHSCRWLRSYVRHRAHEPSRRRVPIASSSTHQACDATSSRYSSRPATKKMNRRFFLVRAKEHRFELRGSLEPCDAGRRELVERSPRPGCAPLSRAQRFRRRAPRSLTLMNRQGTSSAGGKKRRTRQRLWRIDGLAQYEAVRTLVGQQHRPAGHSRPIGAAARFARAPSTSCDFVVREPVRCRDADTNSRADGAMPRNRPSVKSSAQRTDAAGHGCDAVRQ